MGRRRKGETPKDILKQVLTSKTGIELHIYKHPHEVTFRSFIRVYTSNPKDRTEIDKAIRISCAPLMTKPAETKIIDDLECCEIRGRETVTAFMSALKSGDLGNEFTIHLHAGIETEVDGREKQAIETDRTLLPLFEAPLKGIGVLSTKPVQQQLFPTDSRASKSSVDMKYVPAEQLPTSKLLVDAYSLADKNRGHPLVSLL